MHNSKGEPTYAIYGFLALLFKISLKVAATDIVIGFDDHTFSERKTKWPHYKAQREAKSQDLYTQMNEIINICRALAIPVIIAPGLEADDVMASASCIAKSQGVKTVIATSDRDSFALINEDVTVLRLLSGLDNAVFMTPLELFTRYGVNPQQYLEFAALRGDPSDNLPGVKGIGEKTAVNILKTFGTAKEAYLKIDEVGLKIGKAAARRLEEGEREFLHNLEVMEVNRSIPVDLDLTSLRLPRTDTFELLKSYELPSLAAKFEHLFKGEAASLNSKKEPSKPPKVNKVKNVETSLVQDSLF